MTTLRIEVGRFGATAEEVAEWIERAPGTYANRLDVEIDPDAYAYVPIDEIQAALEARGIEVALVPWPDPPPLPWWALMRSWPRRLYMWGRRVVLRESADEQLQRALVDAYAGGDLLHAAAMRESPILGLMKQAAEEEDGEHFVLRGARGFSGGALPPEPVVGATPCGDCGASLFHAPDCEAAVWKQRK